MGRSIPLKNTELSFGSTIKSGLSVCTNAFFCVCVWKWTKEMGNSLALSKWRFKLLFLKWKPKIQILIALYGSRRWHHRWALKDIYKMDRELFVGDTSWLEMKEDFSYVSALSFANYCKLEKVASVFCQLMQKKRGGGIRIDLLPVFLGELAYCKCWLLWLFLNEYSRTFFEVSGIVSASSSSLSQTVCFRGELVMGANALPKGSQEMKY